MFVNNLTENQIKRLKLANKLKKYGHLETWQELFTYQYTIATPKQIKEIAEYASKHNKGKTIKLPLMSNIFNEE